jgi:hypothetical protein
MRGFMISARYAYLHAADQNLIEPVGNSLGCGLFVPNLNCGPGAFLRGARRKHQVASQVLVASAYVRLLPECACATGRVLEAWLLATSASPPPPPRAACAVRERRGSRQRPTRLRPLK